MALVLKDRVVESSTSSGTGAFTLNGAETGYQSFSAVGSGSTVYYTIEHPQTGEWEVGVGTYTTGSLSRDTVLSSSNSGSLVYFSSGQKNVFIDLPSEKAVYRDLTNVTNSLAGVQFDTSATPTIIAGLLGWDGNNTLSLGMAGGNVTQHIGEDQFYYVKASSAITKGQVCMFTGAVGASGVLTAAPATGTTLDGLYIMGIAAESIANNGFGLIQSFGTLRGIDTSAYADGAILWYDPTGTGAYTSTQPAKGYTQVVVAAVASAKNNGTLAIRVTYIPEFSELPGISISSPTTGQALVYNTGTGLWSNSNAVVVNGGSVDNTPIGATTASTGKFTSVTTPSVTADTNNLTLSAISTGSVKLNTAGGTGFQVTDNGTSTTWWTAYGSTVSPVLEANGATANCIIRTSGTGSLYFRTNATLTQLLVAHTASAVNYVQVTGAATTKAVISSSQGSDTNISMAFQPKGTGAIDLAAGSSGVNISNGGTVTAITRTVAGTGYTSKPTLAITAPTTAGGVQAVADVNAMGTIGVTVAGGGAGYTVGDVLTVSGGTTWAGGAGATTFTVTSVSAGVITGVSMTNFGSYTTLPTVPNSATGGTGTGATFNYTYSIANSFNITTAGSGYIEQPTVTFSGGGGSGASAYASVGSGTIVKTLGNTLDFYTPSSITGSVPAFRVTDAGAVAVDSYLMAKPANGYSLLLGQGATNSNIGIFSNGTGRISLGTNSTAQIEQCRIAYTASAVNYVQMTGAATGNQPAITAQGSDANINMNFQAKGSGTLIFNANGAEQFRSGTVGSTVNSLSLSGSTATNAPSLGVRGSDTNIDLALTPKGTGLVRFGTLTANADAPITGYITIKDSAGTTRKLAVIA